MTSLLNTLLDSGFWWYVGLSGSPTPSWVDFPNNSYCITQAFGTSRRGPRREICIIPSISWPHLGPVFTNLANVLTPWEAPHPDSVMRNEHSPSSLPTPPSLPGDHPNSNSLPTHRILPSSPHLHSLWSQNLQLFVIILSPKPTATFFDTALEWRGVNYQLPSNEGKCSMPGRLLHCSCKQITEVEFAWKLNLKPFCESMQ